MSDTIFNPRRMGALPSKGSTSFRVWAPHATSVAVVGDFNNWISGADLLTREEGGMWHRDVPHARAGQEYQFEITNGDRRFRKNDAYAREIHPQTQRSVIYADTYEWKTEKQVLTNWNEMVIYELHVGTFVAGPNGAPGGFDQIIARLPYLKNLGINVIELMPPMVFPSERSWGYNLTNPFAVDASYGGTEGLKRLVDAAHAEGISIVIDVVYNHFGPDDLDLWQYDGWSENNKGGIYFYNDHRSWTPWGENRPDYGREEVRQYIRDNALLWLEEFRADGLRFDSTLFVRNTRGENGNSETDIPEAWTLFSWINDEIQRLFPGCLTIAEDLMQNHWLTKKTADKGAGFGAQWDSAFVHPVRTNVVEPEDQNRSMDEVVRAIEFRYNEDAIQRIIYSESHDEVANGKARIPQEIDPGNPAGYYPRKRSTLAAGLVLTTPGIPMIFEGQEFLEDGWFRDDKALDWTKLKMFQGINRLYHDLIHLRRNLYGNTRGLCGPYVRVSHVNREKKVIAFHRWLDGGAKDDVMVVASFNHEPLTEGYRIGFPRAGKWTVRFNSDWKGYSTDFHDVSPDSGEVEVIKEDYDGHPYSGVVALPAYGLLILSQEETAVEKVSTEQPEAVP